MLLAVFQSFIIFGPLYILFTKSRLAWSDYSLFYIEVIVLHQKAHLLHVSS